MLKQHTILAAKLARTTDRAGVYISSFADDDLLVEYKLGEVSAGVAGTPVFAYMTDDCPNPVSTEVLMLGLVRKWNHVRNDMPLLAVYEEVSRDAKVARAFWNEIERPTGRIQWSMRYPSILFDRPGFVLKTEDDQLVPLCFTGANSIICENFQPIVIAYRKQLGSALKQLFSTLYFRQPAIGTSLADNLPTEMVERITALDKEVRHNENPDVTQFLHDYTTRR